MVRRNYWIERIEEAWRSRPIVWLAGVRRSGKTVLCNCLDDVEYFDCELPVTRSRLREPQHFLDQVRGKRIVLDEIHRLDNPSELLKIAHDHYPDVRTLATGSSTLHASRKFRDTLTGRKEEVWLTPMVLADLEDFKSSDLERRLIAGGLPQFFIEGRSKKTETHIQEWLDSFWSKDIQELFLLEKHSAFMRLLELLMVNSGGLFEATGYASDCEVSRQTVRNYISALEVTKVVQVIRPFSTRRANELKSMPKVYVFDTGFVSGLREWNALNLDNRGILWEHFVLNELNAALNKRIGFWRDKQGHEIDFVISGPAKKSPTAIECKWSSNSFDAAALRIFRRKYPEGENYLVAADCKGSYKQVVDDIEVTITDVAGLVTHLSG